jgi:CBS domain-containing protein
MLKAKDIMAREIISISPHVKTLEAARILLDNRINGLPVVNAEGQVVGIICQSDLVAQQKKLSLPSFFNLLDGLIPLASTKNWEHEMQKIGANTVAQAMTADPVTVTPETGMDEIASLMVDKKYHTLPVIDQGKLVGVIGKEDILRTLLSMNAGERSRS